LLSFSNWLISEKWKNLNLPLKCPSLSISYTDRCWNLRAADLFIQSIFLFLKIVSVFHNSVIKASLNCHYMTSMKLNKLLFLMPLWVTLDEMMMKLTRVKEDDNWLRGRTMRTDDWLKVAVKKKFDEKNELIRRVLVKKINMLKEK
jgi:hypothetical protein